MKTTVSEHLVSIECGVCGEEIAYSGTGRRPRYCSASCRTRAHARRQAARELDRDPEPRVVREVVERHTNTHTNSGHVPRRAETWTRYLDALADQMEYESVLTFSEHMPEFHDLAAAIERVTELLPRLPGQSPAAPAADSDAAGEPGTLTEWLRVLSRLHEQLRADSGALLRTQDDFAELGGVVRQLHDLFAPLEAEFQRFYEPTLTRQQRRALEREQRKNL